MYKYLHQKKQYYFRIVFLIVSIFTIISCRKDDESDPNNPTVEKSIKAYTNQSTNQSTVFQANAIFVKSDINNQFVSYSSTDGSMTFNNNEALNIIKTGDIIYSLPTKDFPDGYAFKIISSKTGKISSSGKTTTGSTIIYSTKPASITEVFKDYACISTSVVDTNVNNTASYDFLTDQQAGNYLLNSTPFGAVSSLVPNFEMKNILDTYKTKHFANPKQYTRFRSLKIGSNETTLEYIVYDLDGKYGTTNDQVVLEMKLNYELKDTKIDVHNTKFNLQGNHKWSSQATLKYEYDKDWTEQEKENFKNKFKGEVVGKKYNVLSIPLTLPNATDLLLKPSFDVFYELQLDISGNIKVVAGVKDYEYSFNINNQNQQSFSLINKGQYFSDVEIGSELNVGMRFGIGVTAEIPAFKLFDVNSLSKKSYAGIYADFGANANVKASVINDSANETCFNFKTNYTADAGIYLEYKIYFISDMTLKDKIPIYTSPSYSGSLADYSKCIPKNWLPNIPTNGLVAYYPFNGNANDESGNKVNGSIIGNLQLVNDRKGFANKAYLFDGNYNNYISIPPSSVNNLQNLSLCAWVKPLQAGGFIISAGRDIETGSFRLTNSSFGTQVSYNGVNGCGASSPLPINEWSFVVGTLDGLYSKYYVNGQLVNSATITNIFSTNFSCHSLVIGVHSAYCNPSSYFPYSFNGVIDDVRIYNRALSQSEILLLYNE